MRPWKDFYRSHDQIDASHKFVVVLKAKLLPAMSFTSYVTLTGACTPRCPRCRWWC